MFEKENDLGKKRNNIEICLQQIDIENGYSQIDFENKYNTQEEEEIELYV